MSEQSAFAFTDTDLPAWRQVPGLMYAPGFVNQETADGLAGRVDTARWSSEMSRRVQHYGWRYDYRSRRVGVHDHLGPLPDWLIHLAWRVQGTAGFATVPDQVIVNEYQPGQGIAGHVDCLPCFGPVVASVSLLSAVEMDFIGPAGEIVSLLVQPRSLLVFTGPARTVWKHGIAKRRRDRRSGNVRTRRVSLTFRTVIPAT